MRRSILLTVLLLTASVAPAEDLSTVVGEMMDVYAEKGAEAFLTAFLEGGPLEGSKEAMSQVNMLRTIESFYGVYESHEMVRAVDAGERAQFLYFVLNYQAGPVFGRATGYKSRDGWHVVNFNFHTEVEQVWPEALISGEG